MDSFKLSPWGNTKVTAEGYLDRLKIRPIPVADDDILYEITPAYTHRPDLLAFDMYGKKELWWVFAQRNINVLKDPVYDFVAGTKIYVPQGKFLSDKLGL
jgi:hypothetical protein